METERNKIEELMENIKQSSVDMSRHQREFRLTLLNAKKSGILGTILLILPLLFVSGVIFKHYLQIDLGILTSVYEWIGDIDHKYGDSSVLNWIIRFFLIIGPLVAMVINFLAILHIRYEKVSREIVVSIKLKWLNLLIILFGSVIFLIFFSYLILENVS